jgi:hypothetical protein
MKIIISVFAFFACAFLLSSCVPYGGCGRGHYWYAEYCPARYCSECQCTDYGYRYNYCMTKRKYCHAFGNVGGR